MAFSYDQSRTTAKDRLRFALGDTVDPGMLQDEDYAASLALHGNNEQAALRNLAAGLAAQLAAGPDRVTLPSGLSVSWSQRVAQLNAIAAAQATTATRGAKTGTITAGTEYKPR